MKRIRFERSCSLLCRKFSHESSVTFVDCVTTLFRGEEGKGEGSSQGAVSDRCQLTAHHNLFALPSPPGTAAKYSLCFHTLNINYMRIGDLIVRITVTLL